MIFSNVRKEMPVAQCLRGKNNFNASPNKNRNYSCPVKKKKKKNKKGLIPIVDSAQIVTFIFFTKKLLKWAEIMAVKGT